MRKLNSLLIIVCVLGIALIPGVGIAELSLMTDDELREVTGQGGISLAAEDMIDFDLNIDTVYYCDDDGTDGTPGYLSLNDIFFKGSTTFDAPVKVDLSTQFDPFANGYNTGINIDVKGVKVDIDQFRIGAIRVGNAPGQGKSFGSFQMSGFSAEISGKVRITFH
jgi:hypothetical protein